MARRARAPNASATCPSASPTTCDVAAVPRNWQPPPGEAQARHRLRPRASSVIWPCAKRAPTDCTLPASSPSSGSSVTPPGTSTHGRSCMPASAIIIAGSPLSQVATPMHAAARGQRADQAPEDGGRVVAVGQAVEHARGALRAAVARVGAVAGERHRARRLQLFRRRLHQQADFPVPGVVAQRDRRAVGGADAAVRAEDQELLAAQQRAGPSPCRRSASSRTGRPRAGASSISGVIGSEPCGPGALERTSKSDASPESRIRSGAIAMRSDRTKPRGQLSSHLC